LGRLIGRFGSKNLIIAATFFVAISTPLALVVPNVWLFRFALLLFGISNSSQDVSMNAQAVLVQHRFSRPIVSLMHCGWSLGGFLAGGGVALASRFGESPFTHTVIANLFLMALILVASRWLLPHEPDDVISEDAFVVPRGLLLVIGLLTMCAFFAEGAAFDWIAVFFRTVLGSSQSMAATAFACFGFAMAGSRAFGDLVVHRIGNRRALLFGGLVAAGGILLAVSMRVPGLSLAGFILSALGLSNLIPILFRAGGSIDGVAPGTGVAAVSTCGYVAFLISAPLIGLIADRSSLSVALGVVGLAGLVVAGFGPGALKHTRLDY
jgi:predicted MFS family arabinose efflux permease